MTFSEGDARQDHNTDVPQGLPIVASTPITKLNIKQSPRVEIETVVHEERYYTTKYFNEFSNSLRNLGNLCGNGF